MNLVRMAPMNSSGAVLPSPPPHTILRMPSPPPALSSCEKLFTSSARSCCAGSRGTAAIPSAKPRWRPTPPSFWMDGSIYHILQNKAGSRDQAVVHQPLRLLAEPGNRRRARWLHLLARRGPVRHQRADGVQRREPQRRRRWKKSAAVAAPWTCVGAESGRRDLPNEAASGEQGRDDDHGGVRCHHGAKERHGGERAVPGGDGEGGRADDTELGDGAGGGQGEEPDGAEDKGGQ
ncbi:uncharacterized protein LOC112872927 [Panicum hallii]|nr:uncharacterized protein LOC112872927 [Panicum hallii]